MKSISKLHQNLTGLKFIDSHFHLWDSTLKRPWLKSMGDQFLNTAFRFNEYRAATKGLPFQKSVHAQTITTDPIAQAVWINQVAKDFPQLVAQIASARIEDGAKQTREDISAYQSLKTAPVVSIRRSLSLEQEDYCLRDKFLDGIRIMNDEFSLPFEIQAGQRSKANQNALELVRKFPKQQFILNHAMKPDIRTKNKNFPNWFQLLTAFSRQKNVVMKLAGSALFHDAWDYNDEELEPYLEHIMKQFGMKRIMTGTDIPVLLQNSNPHYFYGLIYQVAERLGAERKDFERLFRQNAIQFYRLKQ